MQISAQELDALDIIHLVKLLVDGVCRVGGAAHGEEEDILASRLLEG
jgi:hypothetical protein